ncbi:MAG: hypothetical protein K5745_03635, partial [Saccharofermentans sp.]|nr:hypothetical protein [Saccharofermentans sp.]
MKNKNDKKKVRSPQIDPNISAFSAEEAPEVSVSEEKISTSDWKPEEEPESVHTQTLDDLESIDPELLSGSGEDTAKAKADSKLPAKIAPKEETKTPNEIPEVRLDLEGTKPEPEVKPRKNAGIFFVILG